MPNLVLGEGRSVKVSWRLFLGHCQFWTTSDFQLQMESVFLAFYDNMFFFLAFPWFSEGIFHIFQPPFNWPVLTYSSLTAIVLYHWDVRISLLQQLLLPIPWSWFMTAVGFPGIPLKLNAMESPDEAWEEAYTFPPLAAVDQGNNLHFLLTLPSPNFILNFFLCPIFTSCLWKV